MLEGLALVAGELSDPSAIIEHMFDNEFGRTSDADLIAAMEECATAEAAAAARRLAAVAELVRRRCADDRTAEWACDAWDSAAAEVAAALKISHGRASGQMHLAESLRLRLPRIAELSLGGAISARVVAAIAWRTQLVTDPEAMALIEDALAERACGWDALSQSKLDQAIDTWIDRHDPGALRRSRASARSRDVTVGDQNHDSGTTALWGRLYATDATLLDRKLGTMAHGVCDDDPRTIGQRRADALGALAAGSQELTCRCGSPECPSAGPDRRATSIVVHVLADAEAPGAQPDTGKSGPAIIVGGSIVPTPLLAELIRDGARIRYLRKPPDEDESQYRPSTSLVEFIRSRDLTCRFPGCDRPADFCDIDHAIPWPLGPTHPSNLRCLCRKHHLLKTFWAGDGGWNDRQSPDGTIVWTSPTGRSYTTRPGCHLLFPAWDTTVGDQKSSAVAPVNDGRTRTMPLRRRTRTADRTYRMSCERALNAANVAERNKPPPF